MKSRLSQQLFRTKKCTFDLAVEVFCPFYFYCFAHELLSHDQDAFWCVRLPSHDAKAMLNVATLLKTADYLLIMATIPRIERQK